MAERSWRVRAPYDPGDVVRWNGLRLVCTREHYAGDAALHPWDPGDGWSEKARSTLELHVPQFAEGQWTADGWQETVPGRTVVYRRRGPVQSGTADYEEARG